MSRTRITILGLGLLLAGPQVLANDQQHAEHAATGHHAPATMPPDFAKLDANSDGQIEKTELPTDHPMAGHFDMMDKDKDGKISKAEFDEMCASHRNAH